MIRHYRFALTGLVAVAFGVFYEPPADADTAPTSRAGIQHVLRRFAYSASPTTVNSIVSGGLSAWLDQQLAPNTIDDSAAEALLDPVPHKFNPDGSYIDWGVYERRVFQRMVLSQKQLLEKMQLHWMDHFSVGIGKVGDPAVMYHYVDTIRTYALGNFAALTGAVAREPAMLIWLDNNWNTGPIPNENFGRELMLLFAVGGNQLNADGSAVLTAAGLPVPAYTQKDVTEAAKALTGYHVDWNWQGTDPNTRFGEDFDAFYHVSGPRTILGKKVNVPADETDATFVASQLAASSSSAPFLVTELLQRFATETPSPTYISDIVAVWRQNLTASDQIAKVLRAIIAHPEFGTSYKAMPKQPLEFVVDALRQMPVVLQAKDGCRPAQDALYWASTLKQSPFDPPSVFSFYRPGHLLGTYNAQAKLQRANDMSWFVDETADWGCANTMLDIPTLRRLIGATDGAHIAAYLIDALVDTASASFKAKLTAYLGATPSDYQIRGAVWLVLTTPDYVVN